MSDTTPPPPPPPPPPAAAGLSDGPVPPSIAGALYSPGLTILLSFVTCGVWTFIWWYRTGEDLKAHNRDGLGGVLSLVIAIFVSPVLMFTVPGEIRNMYQRDGRTSPVQPIIGLWFLLPLIGNIIWYLKVQRALNEYWVSKGSAAA